MRPHSATHKAVLAVRLTGWHDTRTDTVGDTVQVLIPGAAVTLTHKDAARHMFSAWIESKLISRDLFNGEGARSYRTLPQEITAAVTLTGGRQAPAVTGKAARHSPSGCGQVTVRLGGFAVVCDDRAAWQTQYRVWRDAYELAADRWNIWPVDRFEVIAEERIAERLHREDRR